MEDFFRELEECLRGEVPEEEIRDSIHYYRQYFAEERAAGRSEKEIIQSLGSPRLIARSIIDAREAMEERGAFGQEGTGEQKYYKDAGQDGYYDAQQERYNYEREQRPFQVKRVGGIKLVLGILLFLLILGFLVRILLPVVVILIPIILIWRFIQGNR